MRNWDGFEQELFQRRVRPSGWLNPQPKDKYDLVIIGAGPAGLAAADAGIELGCHVALIERNRLGGDSLNTGSIPSKAIISAGRLRAAAYKAETFGAAGGAPVQTDFGLVLARMHRTRARIAEYHSADRLAAKGVDLFFGDARFVNGNEIQVNDISLHFKKALIATGARPRPPDIEGLDTLDYRTSNTIFEMTALPARLAVIGGGPLGCEMAQAFSRLGTHVTLIEQTPKFLPREERDAAEILSRAMARDGVEIRLNTTVCSARLEHGIKVIETINDDVKDHIPCDEILLSIGRIPNVEVLGLENAGVAFESLAGIKVDAFQRTTNDSVYAAGDVCMPLKFTNAAEATARAAVNNAFSTEQATVELMNIPWCTYCEPEIAHIGMHVWDAREVSIPVKTFTVMMQDVDRGITDGQDIGFVKIHTQEATDKILGATIVASRASEMINELSVVMNAGIGMEQLAGMVHAYPTQSGAIVLAALAYKKGQKKHLRS